MKEVQECCSPKQTPIVCIYTLYLNYPDLLPNGHHLFKLQMLAKASRRVRHKQIGALEPLSCVGSPPSLPTIHSYWPHSGHRRTPSPLIIRRGQTGRWSGRRGWPNTGFMMLVGSLLLPYLPLRRCTYLVWRGEGQICLQRNFKGIYCFFNGWRQDKCLLLLTNSLASARSVFEPGMRIP